MPIIVAINKIDKPDANPQRVRTELLQHEVFVETMGGDVLDVEVSALKGTNLDKLLETILLQAEVLELKANPNRPAEGTVIEAKLDRGRGPVATVLVQRGTLRVGDIVVAGSEWGRVRALVDDHGETVKEAGPSTPVEVLGFQGAPEAGDRFAVVDSEARAREITDYRAAPEAREGAGPADRRPRLARADDEPAPDRRAEGSSRWSSRATCRARSRRSPARSTRSAPTRSRARIIHSGVGGITESDVTLAAASNAAIIGFNVRANAAGARRRRAATASRSATTTSSTTSWTT